LFQPILLRTRYTVILSIFMVAALALNLDLGTQIYDFFSYHPVAVLLNLKSIAPILVLTCIAFLLISIRQLKRSYSSERELGKQRTLHQDLLKNLPIGVAEFDSKLQVKITNNAFKQLSCWIGDAALKALIQQLSDKLGATRSTSEVVLKQRYPGNDNLSTLCIEWHLHQRPDSSFLLLGRDLSRQEDIQEKLSISQRILENTPIGVMVVDTNFSIQYINRSFEQITGYSAVEALAQNPSILHSGKHDRNFFKAMYNDIKNHGYWQGEIWNRKKNGDVYPEWLSITALTDDHDEISHYIGMFSEITAQEHVQERLRTLAYYDVLTSLANRALFNDELERLIKNNIDKNLCVIFLDLDGFKRINDSFGHQVGDRLLVDFAKRLKRNTRDADIVARWGGDEFIIAIEVSDADIGIPHFCNKQLKMLSFPFALDGRDWSVSASIGVSIFGDNARTAHDLVRNADLAMYQAKRRGKNRYEIFSPKLHEDVSESIEIESRLRTAIHTQQLDVYFQPQVQSGSAKIYGLEALARWQDKELGNVSPQKFIKVAEDTGMIKELSDLIFFKALKQFREWQKIDPDLILSLNLSASQLQDDELITSLTKLTKKYSIDPLKIKLEITEDVFMSDIKKSVHTTTQLKNLSYKISLDDFGTGYSSFSYLKDFHIDELKIDRSFVKNINTSKRNKAIVASIVAMTKILDINCIIEGVETKDQLIELQNMGCTFFQGYLFHKPMPAEEIELLLQQEVRAIA